MFGNTSFIGARGPLCTDSDVVPTPGPFILDPSTTTDMSVQSDFQQSNQADAFTCVLPPNGGDFWPFGLNPSNSSSIAAGTSGTHGTKSSSSNTAGVAVGVIVAVIAAAVITWFARKKFIARREAAFHFNSTKQAEYTQKI